MKFSTIFSLFLATLSVGVSASPIPSDAVAQAPENRIDEVDPILSIQEDETSTEYSHLAERATITDANDYTARDWQKEDDHQKWEAKKTDCKTFVDYIKSIVKINFKHCPVD